MTLVVDNATTNPDLSQSSKEPLDFRMRKDVVIVEDYPSLLDPAYNLLNGIGSDVFLKSPGVAK